MTAETREKQPEVTDFRGYIEGVRHSVENIRTPWVLGESVRMQTRAFLFFGGSDHLTSRGF